MWKIARESDICAREYRKREKTQGFAVIIGKNTLYPTLLQYIIHKKALLRKQSVSQKEGAIPQDPPIDTKKPSKQGGLLERLPFSGND